jgi:hypothetical protein
LYLPRRWTDDPQRCSQAGLPAERGFTTKPELVLEARPPTASSAGIRPLISARCGSR